MKNTTLLIALTLTAATASAQQPPPAPRASAPAVQVDARFAAWLGCWRLDDDLAGTGARMCITPEQNGVRLQTVIGTNKGIDELVIPDAVARPLTDAECTGTEQAEWSADGARMFRTTKVTCGKEAERIIKGVAFMTPGPSWINVQHVSGAGANTSVRVQRYRRAANQALADGSRAQQPDATLATRTTQDHTRWSVEDVIEANAKVPAEALQAALTEVRHPFDLSKKTLVAMDDAGVHDQVVDLMVALTYPKRFVIERAGGSAPTGISTGGGWFDPLMPGIAGGMMGDCFSPYGYGYRSYYSMCGPSMYGFPFGLASMSMYYGYNGYGYYPHGYYGYSGGWVNVGAVPPGSGTIAGPTVEGRVINGRGYTQIRDRESDPSPRVNAGGNGGAWAGSGSGGVSSGGYSSGGGASSGSGGGAASGGDSGARTAVPKGGGGR